MAGIAEPRLAMAARKFGSLLVAIALCGCVSTPPPAVTGEMQRIEGDFPADFSGSWERNYARGGDIRSAYYQALDRLYVTRPDRNFASAPAMGAGVSPRQADALVALARLAEQITAPDVLAISQSEHEIVIEREDDYAILCAFYDGAARATVTGQGTEICGWDGHDLVAQLSLPGELDIAHRFTVSEQLGELRVTTTISAPSSPVPFEISRYYRRFERLPPDHNCIETLSKRRVCSYGR
jgi:hypothetical protein